MPKMTFEEYLLLNESKTKNDETSADSYELSMKKYNELLKAIAELKRLLPEMSDPYKKEELEDILTKCENSLNEFDKNDFKEAFSEVSNDVQNNEKGESVSNKAPFIRVATIVSSAGYSVDIPKYKGKEVNGFIIGAPGSKTAIFIPRGQSMLKSSDLIIMEVALDDSPSGFKSRECFAVDVLNYAKGSSADFKTLINDTYNTISLEGKGNELIDEMNSNTFLRAISKLLTRMYPNQMKENFKDINYGYDDIMKKIM